MNDCLDNSVICKICKNTKDNKSYELREMMFGYRDTFHYFECGACGCLQINNFPDDIEKYYPDKYYSFSDVSEVTNAQSIRIRLVNSTKQFLKNARATYAISGKSIFGRIIYDLAPSPDLKSLSAITLTKKTRILDIGCGGGRLLRQLMELGFDQLLGADPYIGKTIKYPGGLTILNCTADAIDANYHGKFDVIMMHHALEHVADPSETLKSISTLLQSDGTCLIRVPTTSSYAWTHYRENWVQADAPRHFFLFSIDSMGILARDANFRIDQIIYDSNEFQYWGSEQYIQNIPLEDCRSFSKNPRNSIFSRKSITEFKTMAKALNQAQQGDQCVFVLKKNA